MKMRQDVTGRLGNMLEYFEIEFESECRFNVQQSSTFTEFINLKSSITKQTIRKKRALMMM